MFTDADAWTMHAEDNVRLDRLALERLQSQRSVYDNLQKSLSGQADETEHQKMAENSRNMFTLPNGHTIERQVGATSNPRLKDIICMYQDSQCALIGALCLAAFAADPASQLDVLGHDGDAFRVNGAKVGIFEETNHVCLRRLL